VHHVATERQSGKVGSEEIHTAFFFSAAAVRSARAFSWLFLFLRRVSGTRIWSLVGTELEDHD
jgi:hypothetical protein